MATRMSMSITRDNVDLFRKAAKATREKWQQQGITPKSTGFSEAVYEECIAWSVLEQYRIERTEANVKRVLALMSER